MFKLPYQQQYDRARCTPIAFIPFKTATIPRADVTFEGFGFPGSATAPGVFQNGWRVVVPDSDLRQLVAMFTGSVQVAKLAAPQQGYLLRLKTLDPCGMVPAFRHLRPEWLPLPRTVVYENVDIAALHNDLVGF